MAKRKRKEAPAPSSTNGAVQGFAEKLRADSNKLHELQLVCGHLNRSKAWGPDQIEKFITRVFVIAGIVVPNPAPVDAAQSD